MPIGNWKVFTNKIRRDNFIKKLKQDLNYKYKITTKTWQHRGSPHYYVQFDLTGYKRHKNLSQREKEKLTQFRDEKEALILGKAFGFPTLSKEYGQWRRLVKREKTSRKIKRRKKKGRK